jgi:hypothetical protein
MTISHLLSTPQLVWYGDMGNAIRTAVCTGKKVKHLQEIILVSSDD